MEPNYNSYIDSMEYSLVLFQSPIGGARPVGLWNTAPLSSNSNIISQCGLGKSQLWVVGGEFCIIFLLYFKKALTRLTTKRTLTESIYTHSLPKTPQLTCV